MYNKKSLTTVFLGTLLFVLATLAPEVAAEAPLVINYQGLLTDATSTPVLDGTYQIVFSIYDDATAGNELWREVHPSVVTSNGLFNVTLGSITLLDQSVFNTQPLWLEIAVGADPPLSPRTLLTSVPSAVKAFELDGSVQTTSGVLSIHPPDPFNPSDTFPHIQLIADTFSTQLIFMPPDPCNPMGGGSNGGGITGGITTLTNLEMVGSFFDVMYTVGCDKQVSDTMNINLIADSSQAKLSILQKPGDGSHGSEVAISSAPSTGATIKMFNPQPEPPGQPILMVNGGTVNNGASIRMFNPQPEPPGEPILEMLSGIGEGASINVFNPKVGVKNDKAISDTLVQISADSLTGGSVVIRNPINGLSSIRTGESLTFNSPAGGSSILLNGAGDSYFINSKIGLGTYTPSNILTVVQSSSTDPIADAWTTYSSRRWKTDIKTIDNALEKVQRLRGVTYQWKKDSKHDIGLIAEEVGKVIPEIVVYEENGKDARSVDYARLVALLIEAVKEQQKTINTMQKKISESENLQAEIAQLTAIVKTLLAEQKKSNINKEKFSKYEKKRTVPDEHKRSE